jgi:hypothetical protein
VRSNIIHKCKLATDTAHRTTFQLRNGSKNFAINAYSVSCLEAAVAVLTS